MSPGGGTFVGGRHAAKTGWTTWIPPVFAGHVPTPDPEFLKSFSLQHLGGLFHLHVIKKSEVLAQGCWSVWGHRKTLKMAVVGEW